MQYYFFKLIKVSIKQSCLCKDANSPCKVQDLPNGVFCLCMIFQDSILLSLSAHYSHPTAAFDRRILALCGQRDLLDCLMAVKVDITSSFLFSYPFRQSLSLTAPWARSLNLLCYLKAVLVNSMSCLCPKTDVCLMPGVQRRRDARHTHCYRLQ